MSKFIYHFIICFAFFVNFSYADSLKVAIVDVAPFGYVENEKIKGINFEIFKELEKKSKLDFEYRVYPHARIINSLSTPGPDLTITFERHCQSNSDLYEIQKYLYTAKTTLFLNDFKKIPQKPLKIGIIRNTCSDIVKQYLSDHKIIELINMNQAIKMTSLGRLDGICGLKPVVEFSQHNNANLHLNLNLIQTNNTPIKAVLCRKKSLADNIKQKLDMSFKDYENKVNY